MIKYPIGIQDFQKLREEGYLYIDKTKAMFQLLQFGQYYFLSRPRRFGKSLLVSTLKYLFQGKKELFEGLWIENQHDWKEHPVLHISFSSIGFKTLGLATALDTKLDDLAASHDIQLEKKTYDQKFAELLKKLSSKGAKVVLLMDEYDKPLVDYIENPEQAEENRNILKSFFSILKDSDQYLRFFLITGVSKFSKVSLFSDLNNLEDITLASSSSTLAGYTQPELAHYFEPALKQLAISEELSYPDLLDKVRQWYNGYQWSGPEKLYNPFSILNLVKQQRFANFWWDTGTPTFLVNRLRQNFSYNLEALEMGSDVFESYTIENLEWKALLFQTGYLTIHRYDKEDRLFTLGYPNLEVKEAMHRHLLGAFSEKGKSESQPLFVKLKRALQKNDLAQMMELVDVLFASIPHQLFQQKQEAFFHAILHLSFSGIGLLVESEVSTAKGRVDTVVHTKDRIYVMEFKLDDSVDAALAQIREKRYGSRFLHQGKEVMAIGVQFGSSEKAVVEWRAVPYETLLIEG